MLSSRFVFRPSAQVGGLLLAGGCCAVIGALIIPIPVPFRAIVAGALVVAFGRAVQRHARRRGAGAMRGLFFRANGDVEALDATGAVADSGVVISRFVSASLSVVVIAGKRRRHVAMIMPDTLPPDDYRQLRVRLNATTMDNAV